VGERFEAESDRFWDKEGAKKLYARASKVNEAIVTSFKESTKTISRPTPLRTDDLLRDMARLTGLSAAKMLQVAEDYAPTDTYNIRGQRRTGIGLNSTMVCL